MPRKVRELITDLERAGFVGYPGKGSHRKFWHAKGVTAIISGKLGDDAKKYQEKQVAQKIQEVEK